jgi:hypothetical protein
MIDQERAFLDSISTGNQPEASRSQYATWLKARGDVRGEYLELQNELCNPHRKGCGNDAMYARMNEIRSSLSSKWLLQVDWDFAIPYNLCSQGRSAAQAILGMLTEDNECWSGGCRAFFSPQEWRNKGHELIDRTVLVVLHDGGIMSEYFDPVYGGQRYERQLQYLRENSFFAEHISHFYAEILPIGNQDAE